MPRDQVAFSLSKTRHLKTLRAVLLPLPPTTITISIGGGAAAMRVAQATNP